MVLGVLSGLSVDSFDDTPVGAAVGFDGSADFAVTGVTLIVAVVAVVAAVAPVIAVAAVAVTAVAVVAGVAAGVNVGTPTNSVVGSGGSASIVVVVIAIAVAAAIGASAAIAVAVATCGGLETKYISLLSFSNWISFSVLGWCQPKAPSIV
jgi:hypothetical protein